MDEAILQVERRPEGLRLRWPSPEAGQAAAWSALGLFAAGVAALASILAVVARTTLVDDPTGPTVLVILTLTAGTAAGVTALGLLIGAWLRRAHRLRAPPAVDLDERGLAWARHRRWDWAEVRAVHQADRPLEGRQAAAVVVEGADGDEVWLAVDLPPAARRRVEARVRRTWAAWHRRTHGEAGAPHLRLVHDADTDEVHRAP